MRLLPALTIGLATCLGQAHAAERRLLVSLVPPALSAGEYIGSFKIETDGVAILSVCHVPFGWTVTAGMGDSRSGQVSGEGGLGGSLISRDSRNLSQLRGLFLIGMNPGVDRPKITGWMEIGRYGATERPGRKVALAPRLLMLTTASRCPAAGE